MATQTVEGPDYGAYDYIAGGGYQAPVYMYPGVSGDISPEPSDPTLPTAPESVPVTGGFYPGNEPNPYGGLPAVEAPAAPPPYAPGGSCVNCTLAPSSVATLNPSNIGQAPTAPNTGASPAAPSGCPCDAAKPLTFGGAPWWVWAGLAVLVLRRG